MRCANRPDSYRECYTPKKEAAKLTILIQFAKVFLMLPNKFGCSHFITFVQSPVVDIKGKPDGIKRG